MTAAFATTASSSAPAFLAGERVRVLDVHPPGHIRTPYYIRGKTGVIERFVGHFRNPEERAYGRSGEPLRALYRVRFVQSQVWDRYGGAPCDTVDIDIYEHWLEHVKTP
ncbi:MAG: SH3-like domain-containing protein [Burkholderiales bacterium]